MAGVLSVGNKQLFKSGAAEFNETGWWTLIENRPPSLKNEPSIKGILLCSALIVNKNVISLVHTPKINIPSFPFLSKVVLIFGSERFLGLLLVLVLHKRPLVCGR